MGHIEVSLWNLGTINKNAVTIEKNGRRVKLYFSYEILIAVDELVSENDWSKTTSKFLHELQPDKKQRVPHEKVLEETQSRLKAVLG